MAKEAFIHREPVKGEGYHIISSRWGTNMFFVDGRHLADEYMENHLYLQSSTPLNFGAWKLACEVWNRYELWQMDRNGAVLFVSVGLSDIYTSLSLYIYVCLSMIYEGIHFFGLIIQAIVFQNPSIVIPDNIKLKVDIDTETLHWMCNDGLVRISHMYHAILSNVSNCGLHKGHLHKANY